MSSNVFAIDKPLHWTSNDVIQKLKKTLHLKKIGHGGTLDPLATGVLIIGINNGTKSLSTHLNETKEYVTTITFGYETTTGDLEGEVIHSTDTTLDINQLQHQLEVLQQGLYWQTPPAYSAIKINGKPAYAYARSQQNVELPAREVKLLNYEIIALTNCELTIKITVSKGFYVRSFAKDLAASLNTYATITSLRRTRSGDFSIEDAYTMEEFINVYQQSFNKSK